MTTKRQPKRPDRAYCNISPVPREHIKLIVRIWLADKIARREAGLSRSTRGIIQRLAAEFNVSERMIRHLFHERRRGSYRFKDIKLYQERFHEKQRAIVRRSYTRPGSGTK